MKLPESQLDQMLKQQLIRFLQLVNGWLSIGFIALLVWGIVQFVGVFV